MVNIGLSSEFEISDGPKLSHPAWQYSDGQINPAGYLDSTPITEMSLQLAQKVFVFANNSLVFRTHEEEASRLLREGLAVRRDKGRKVRTIDLVTTDVDCSKKEGSRGNPQKYTFVEALGKVGTCGCGGVERCYRCGGTGTVLLIDSHCQSLKLQAADKRNWPIFRAAVVDCLAPHVQGQIRDLFKPKQKRRQAA